MISVPLVAQRAIAGVGASGVFAGLLGTTGVSSRCTFIYVCREHRRGTVSRGRPSSIPVRCRKKNKQLKQSICLGYTSPVITDVWTVSHSQICDPWHRHNANGSTSAHICAECGQLNKGSFYSAAGGEFENTDPIFRQDSFLSCIWRSGGGGGTAFEESILFLNPSSWFRMVLAVFLERFQVHIWAKNLWRKKLFFWWANIFPIDSVKHRSSLKRGFFFLTTVMPPLFY